MPFPLLSTFEILLNHASAWLYHARVEIGNLDRAKAPGLVDRKSVHISSQPRELSHGTKSLFQPRVVYVSPSIRGKIRYVYY